jgi:tellurite resistance protein
MAMKFDPAAFFGQLDHAKLGALVETMILAADADGELGDDEKGELAAQIQRLAAETPLEPLVTGEALAALLSKAQEDLARDGREARLQAVKEQLGDADSKKGALGLAILITAADGFVRTSERELILDMAEALDVDRDAAADLVLSITSAKRG